MPIFTFLISDLPRGLWTKAFLWKNSQIKLEKMTLVSVFQVSNFLSYSHYKIKGTYEKKNWFRPGGHCHMNSQIMENVIQYYLHVYDNARRIYSQNKSEYRTANYLYWGAVPDVVYFLKRMRSCRNPEKLDSRTGAIFTVHDATSRHFV